jgi:formylglycine-generating enzyme required for sulfatase activity
MFSRRSLIVAAALVTAASLGPTLARANDTDGDGVDDATDVCNSTPPGTPVDATGRPLGDIDLDCDTDSNDFSSSAACVTGPGFTCPPSCAGADLDNDDDVDLIDFALLQQGMTGLLDPLGACCYPNGTCVVLTQAGCGGTWQGAGSPCTPYPCIPPNMALIPTGEFQMGDTFTEGGTQERPTHAVSVDNFFMDMYEVTNQQYCDALNWAWQQGNLIQVTGNVVHKYGGPSYVYCDTTAYSSYSRITWNGSTFGVVAGKGNHPMVHVSWYGAAAYANWRSAMQGRPLCYDLATWTCNFGSGYRLPTEAEWEKAARGGVAGKRFPWSDQNTIQHARCNYYSSTAYSYDTSPTRGQHPLWYSPGTNSSSPVGFFNGSVRLKADWGWPGSATSYQTANAVNGYGLYDMAGNVFEWCNDWYSSTYYASSPYNNPTGPTSGEYRVARGGGSGDGAFSCRVACRINTVPANRYSSGGFRLVLDFP